MTHRATRPPGPCVGPVSSSVARARDWQFVMPGKASGLIDWDASYETNQVALADTARALAWRAGLSGPALQGPRNITPRSPSVRSYVENA